MTQRGRFGLAAVGVVAVGAITGTLGVVPAVADQSDYPSWQDVQKAKGDERAAQAEVDRITALLATLQSSADAAGRTSQIAAERALRAEAAAHDARVKLAAVQSAERTAAAKAQTSRMRAGLLAAHLARSADGDLATQLLIDGRDADDLLDRLSSMSELSAQTQAIYDQAVEDDRAVAAQRDQVAAATAALGQQQRAADDAAASARTTAEQAAAAVAAQQTDATRLVAQLADLRSTSTRVAAQYAAGVTAQRQQAAAAAAAAAAERQRAAAAASGSGSSSGGSSSSSSSGSSSSGGSGSSGSSSGGSGSSSGSSGSSSPVRAPNSALAASAVAFARDQIGDPYVFAGAGPSSWDCSGLTMQAYASVGIGIGGHSATAQYDLAASQGQLVPYADVQVGDLIFYTDGGGDMYHVAIYSGSGMMIEAPYEGVPVREVAVRDYQRVDMVARPTS